jgi:hypothetical protein
MATRRRRAQDPNEQAKLRTECATPPVVPPPGMPQPLPLVLDGTLPHDPHTSRRSRGELRLSLQHVFDTNIRKRLEHELAKPETPLKDVLAIAELYARTGVGFLGTNELDPADIAQLPPPVIQVLDPDAPLPDGKPDPLA